MASGSKRKAAGLTREDLFYLHYGKALAAWANLEFVLCLWFTYLTGRRPADARTAFYETIGFGTRRKMVKKVLRDSANAEVRKFLSRALKVAHKYNLDRNRLAHNLFVVNEHSGDVQLVDRGMWWDEDGLKLRHLREMEAQFDELKTILIDVLVHVSAPFKTLPKMTPIDGLQRLLALPKPPP